MPKHLEAHVFDLPVQELRRGYLSDIYFWREKITLEHHNLHPQITMQVFQKKEAVLCGVDEAVAVLKLAAGKYTDYPKAYKLFDKLIELKDQARRQFIGNHDAYLKTIRQKMEVSQQLDELWHSGFEQLKVESLYDGDQISAWETAIRSLPGRR
jgi:nicotinate phosphoribosyltransferase